MSSHENVNTVGGLDPEQYPVLANGDPLDDFYDEVSTWDDDEPVERPAGSDYPATREEIVATFLLIPHRNLAAHNWGCAGSREDERRWHCNGETYINGVMVTVDFDFIIGYVIECVDRTLGTLSYHAVVAFHGQRPDGSHEHESVMYDPPCGTFFERSEEADRCRVSMWGVSVIHGMVEDYWDRRAKARETF